MKFFELHEKNRLICANWYIIANNYNIIIICRKKIT